MTDALIRTAADWIAVMEAQRKRRGWTHAQLENAAQLGESYWSKVVCGKKNPTLETMAKVQRAVGLELSVVSVL